MITINVKDNKVVLTDTDNGEVTYVDYVNNIDIYAVAYLVGQDKHIEALQSYHGPHRIEGYNKISKKLGTSCANFCKMLNGAMFNAYIKPYAKIQHRFSIAGTHNNKPIYNSFMVNKVCDTIDTISKYIRDGQANLAGLGMLIGSSQKAKQVLGDDLWKDLSNNSMTRNDAITKSAVMCVYNPKYNIQNLISCVKELNNIPSTLLRNLSISTIAIVLNTTNSTGYDDIIPKIITHIKKPLYKITNHDVCGYIRQIKNAHTKLGRIFNVKWNIKRLIEEYNRALREEYIKKQSIKLFPFITSLPLAITQGGFVAEMCISAREIAILGRSLLSDYNVNFHTPCAYTNEYFIYNIYTSKDNKCISMVGIASPFTNKELRTNYYFIDKDRTEKRGVIDFMEYTANYVKRHVIENNLRPIKKEKEVEMSNIINGNEIPF